MTHPPQNAGHNTTGPVCSQRLGVWLALALCCAFAGAILSCSSNTGTEEGVQEAAAEPTSSNDGGATEATAEGSSAAETTPSDLDLQMKAEDFGCILKWTKVNRYRITNKLGFEEEALKVARSADGGTFPVGTIIQLVPQEAMVKRKKGWNTKTNDWEFFFLKVDKSGTTIETRGKEDVKNGFGGNCFECHAKADSKWDLICGEDHGCDPLPLSPSVIESIQNSDPRCP